MKKGRKAAFFEVDTHYEMNLKVLSLQEEDLPSSTTQEPKTPQKVDVAVADEMKSKNPYSIEALLQNTAAVVKRKLTDDITTPDKKVKQEDTSEEELKVEDDENDD